MRKNLILFFSSFVILITLLAFFGPSFAQDYKPTESEAHIIVRFASNVSDESRKVLINSLSSDLKAQISDTVSQNALSQLSKMSISVIDVPKIFETQALKQLSSNHLVSYAELDYEAYKLATSNDPDLNKQWGIAKIQVASETSQSAWDVVKGNSNIKVAVLDTGIYKDHADLTGHVILEKDFTGSASGVSDTDGHGTHIAGAIAAATNNGVGGAGVAYDASLLNGKVLGDNGYGSYSGIASGIIWATDNGAKVINLSLGGSSNSQALQDAVNYAHSKGVVVIAAAGNSGSQSPIYPAYYESVISVTATDSNDLKPSWATYGTWVDVAAPGVSIYSTYKDGSYQTYSGSSMASSYVSGLAVLGWATNKCTDDTCIANLIQNNADAIAGTGSSWKYGRVNAYRTVSSNASVSPTVTATPSPTTVVSSPTPTTVITSTTPTPTTTAVQKTLSSSISMWYTTVNSRKNIYTQITVKDQNNQSVSGASVSVRLTTPQAINYTGSATTSQSGSVTFVLQRQTRLGTYSASIISLSKTGYTVSGNLPSTSLQVN